MQRAVKAAHLVEQVGVFLGRMAADMEKREHQRGELVPHRQTCEDGFRPPLIGANGEAGRTLAAAIETRGDFVGLRGDFLDQRAHFSGLRAVVQRRDQFDRTAQVRKVGLERGGGGGVENGHRAILLGRARPRVTVWSARGIANRGILLVVEPAGSPA